MGHQGGSWAFWGCRSGCGDEVPGADVEALSGFSEYSDDVFYFHYEESVIALEIDRDGSFGIKEHFVILS